MENIIKEIKNNPLFYNMKEEEIMSVLKCGFATLENYTDNQMLFEKDQKVNKLGIVIEGVLNLVSQKYNGSRVIVTTLEKNDLFGEALIYASQGVSPYDLVSSGKSKVLLIPYRIFSNMVREGDTPAEGFWWTLPMKRALSFSFRLSMFFPFRIIKPFSCLMAPLIMLKRVVFPHPFAPNIPVHSPLFI
jgi:signal-transduction protein with cAMP-binding, CBS, and nucleotidyltransferase domain